MEQDELRIKSTHLAALILAIFGGNAALTWYKTEPTTVRPDPFTGSDGRQMESKLQRQIDFMDKRIDALRSDLNLCLARMHDPPRGHE